PEELATQAAAHGQEVLALTDRDGVYGAVKFAKACLRAGVRPVLGVDLAVASSGLLSDGGTATSPAGARASRRTPVRGGASVDPRHLRVVVLARSARGTGRAGWAALNRLVSATHLAGERGKPVSSTELVGGHAAGGDLLVLLGPASELVRALAPRPPAPARRGLRH